jgi:hypothetical protein
VETLAGRLHREIATEDCPTGHPPERQPQLLARFLA